MTPADVLHVWERAVGGSHPARAFALLRLARPADHPDDLVRLSPGRRDAALMDLRARLFGDRVEAVAQCGACGTELELDFRLGDVRAAADPAEPETEVRGHGHVVRFRLPDSEDLLAALHPGDAGVTRTGLLRRCVLQARRGRRSLAAEELPDAVVEVVEARMAELDPQADVRIVAGCPDCGQDTEVLFDIAAHLWDEVHTWCRRTLWDVHLLASSYAWSESDVLAMSPARRHFYLEAVGL
ncbi:T4 family baseplate hub assembly chaperone [Streptomyces chartreusis]